MTSVAIDDSPVESSVVCWLNIYGYARANAERCRGVELRFPYGGVPERDCSIVFFFQRFRQGVPEKERIRSTVLPKVGVRKQTRKNGERFLDEIKKRQVKIYPGIYICGYLV